MSDVIIGDISPYTQAVAILNQTVFSTNWTANFASDVVVYQTPVGDPPDDETQILAYPADFSVAFIGALLEVQVTLVTPAGAGDIITITRQTPASRENIYTNTNFTPSMLNNDFEILTLVDQQAQLVDQLIGPRYNYSAIIAPNLSFPNANIILPILGPNEIWVKNPSDTAIIALEIPTSGFAPSDATYVTISDETSVLPNSFRLMGTSNQIVLSTGSNQAILTIATNPVIPGTGAIGIPSGTTAQRVVTGQTPFRYNSTLDSLEFFSLGTWSQVSDNTDGIVLPGLINELAWYAATGNTVSGLPTANNGLLITSAAGVPSILAGPGTTGNVLQSNAAAPPSYSTATYPSTTTINQLLYSSAANTVVGLATANDSVLITGPTGVPSLSTVLPGGLTTTDPTLTQGIATKHYVDQNSLNGTSVYAASAATLGTVTQAGAGPGATITNAGAQVVFALDGVNPPVGTNVLIKDTAVGMVAANEGIFTVSNVGSVATNWVLTRAIGYDTASEINNTGLIVIQNGSTLAGQAWYNTNTIVTVDTTALNFVRFGTTGTVTSISAGAGITLTPNPIVSTGSLAITAANTNITSMTGLTGILKAPTAVQDGSGNALMNWLLAGNTQPQQPSFYAHVTADSAAVTGDGTVYTLVNFTERFDRGNNFDPTTGLFTAPVSGIYAIFCSITVNGLGAGNTDGRSTLVAGTFAASQTRSSWAAVRTANNETILNMVTIVQLAAATVCSINIAEFNNGSKNVVVKGGSGDFSNFGACLLC